MIVLVVVKEAIEKLQVQSKPLQNLEMPKDVYVFRPGIEVKKATYNIIYYIIIYYIIMALIQPTRNH